MVGSRVARWDVREEERPNQGLTGFFPVFLQGTEEVRPNSGAQEFVIFNHGRSTDAQRRQRGLDADYASCEEDTDGIGQGDVRGKGQSDFQRSSRGNRSIK